jgi:xanthine phosphoribosyltransferase
MSDKVYYTHGDVQGLTQEVLRQMQKDEWKPDYVVGLTRGGLLPALYISHYLNVPMETLKVSLRDSENGPESNLWMAEDAFGYNAENVGEKLCKNILIVDDINDTGATLDWIIQDWQSGCLPADPRWQHVWGHNVKFAVLVDNLGSNFSRKVDYFGTEVSKEEDNRWIVFPFEEWWV